jgi:hypothetical protein
MIMSFICSCRNENQPKAIYPKGTSHHTRLFRGPSPKCMKKFVTKLMVASGDPGQGCVLQYRPAAPGSSVLCGLQCGAQASYGGDQRHVGFMS